MADRTLIVVNYRTASLCRAAVESARASSEVPLEVVVVDNSCDTFEAAALDGVGADRVIVASENLGYAGGVNAGLRASSGAKVVVSNPDVVFAEGCVDRLVEQLEGKVALTGPRFFWDDAQEWLLPPADLLDMRSMLSRTLTQWSLWHATRRGRARLRARVAFWRSAEPFRVRAVSGAVMALDRSALERVGGFDERYRLYYEEIDLMRSLAQEGFEIRFVPAARCRHIYDQSAAGAEEHQRKFAESETLYMRKWYGASAAIPGALVRREPPRHPSSRVISVSDPIVVPAPHEDHVVEVSPLESFDTAAGHFPRGGEARLPREVWEAFRGEGLFVRVAEIATGREISRGLMLKSK